MVKEYPMDPELKRKLMKMAVLLVVLLLAAVWTAWGNTALELNTYSIRSERIPEEFYGFRIAHISDLHNTEIGKGNEKLLNMLGKAQPDLIAITGDLIDSRNTKLSVALDFVEKAMEIAPCYYVAGNHESRIKEYDVLKSGMEAAGVVVLENELVEISAGEATITLLGMKDPSFPMELKDDSMEANVLSLLNSFWPEDDSYKILLSHRPELIDTYAVREADLVLSGHAHGGQFRLPLIGGLYAPQQGWFPKYDAGLIEKDGTNMIVSRGIGNSLFPFRVNNRPEVVLVQLEP